MPRGYAPVRKGTPEKLTVALCFAHSKLFQRFDALQQSIQVTTIPTKSLLGYCREGCLVSLGFRLKRLDQIIEILRHGVLRCPDAETLLAAFGSPGERIPIPCTPSTRTYHERHGQAHI
jgi:hypothetical protein